MPPLPPARPELDDEVVSSFEQDEMKTVIANNIVNFNDFFL